MNRIFGCHHHDGTEDGDEREKIKSGSKHAIILSQLQIFASARVFTTGGTISSLLNPSTSRSFPYIKSLRSKLAGAKVVSRKIASLGQASSQNPQKIQRSILISYFTAYFSSRYKFSSPALRSAPSIVIASAGQATAHKPHAVQRSLPSSSLFNTCKPRNTGLNSLVCSGKLIVGLFLNICL